MFQAGVPTARRAAQKIATQWSETMLSFLQSRNPIFELPGEHQSDVLACLQRFAVYLLGKGSRNLCNPRPKKH